MIPLKDINPTKSFPFVNVMLISANVLVFLYQITLSPNAAKAFLLANATIPARIPALGAGGGIGGVMGGCGGVFPSHRLLTFFFIFLIPVRGILILGYWFVLQFVGGFNGVGMGAGGGGAWWALIGGFLMGVVIA